MIFEMPIRRITHHGVRLFTVPLYYLTNDILIIEDTITNFLLNVLITICFVP